ncbi:unnamed protein product [Lymnaea stagnalis]|uniref:Uncharacterized protein n=1 Tax=Lymnaea stagnalis TaxID=6523 RepID=A0AAV2I6A5_LYMST
MATASFLLCVVAVSCHSTFTTSVLKGQPAAPTPNSTLDYLVRTLDGLELTLDFFQREHRVVNLDAVIGTRIVEATFNVLLQRLDSSDLTPKIPPYVMSRIQHLRDAARDVSKAATPYIISNEPDYYDHIGPVIAEGLFELDYDSRDISQTSLVWPYNPQEAMREEDSDGCLAEIFGTSNGMTCAISNKCWKQMTALGYSGYSLSHEIFYLELAERFGCQLEMQWQMISHSQPSLRKLQDVFCANMLFEANLIAKRGFPARHQDLFMEQAALCGLLGFREFFNNDWLVQILSWQDKTDGCYKWSGWPGNKSKHATHQTRIKREEKRVDNGCLCHRTTVAASALSQYVRYILEVWLQEQM